MVAVAGRLRLVYLSPMRLALAMVVLALCSCGSSGGGHKADAHPVDERFAPAVGTWTARCTATSGPYVAIFPLGTTATVTIDNRGLMRGFTQSGQTVAVWLSVVNVAEYFGRNGAEEYRLNFYSAGSGGPITASIFIPGADGGIATWTLVPTAPG